jgi:aspartyl-tRNA(Asn)/glutamyl-tRNA(Gln) amidotransferase subunit C
MKITDADVHHVARLAELAVDDTQASRLAGELATIVSFVEQLNELADDPAAHTVVVGPLAVRLREDVVAPIPMTGAVAEFAPAMAQGFFVVPRLDGLADG